MDKVPGNLRDKLGIAISQQAYKSYRIFWKRPLAAISGPWRASTASALCEHGETKDPQASDVLYIGALAAPNTSTPCPKKRFSPLMRMAGSIGPCRVMAATATRR